MASSQKMYTTKDKYSEGFAPGNILSTWSQQMCIPSTISAQCLSHLPVNLVYKAFVWSSNIKCSTTKTFFSSFFFFSFLCKLLTASCSLATSAFKAASSLWIQRPPLASSRDILVFAGREILETRSAFKDTPSVCTTVRAEPACKGRRLQAFHLDVSKVFCFNQTRQCFTISPRRDLELTGMLYLVFARRRTRLQVTELRYQPPKKNALSAFHVLQPNSGNPKKQIEGMLLYLLGGKEMRCRATFYPWESL